MMSVELRRYLMASNIPTAELSTGSPQPLMQCVGCCQLAVLHLADRASLSSVRPLRRLCPLGSGFEFRV